MHITAQLNHLAGKADPSIVYRCIVYMVGREEVRRTGFQFCTPGQHRVQRVLPIVQLDCSSVHTERLPDVCRRLMVLTSLLHGVGEVAHQRAQAYERQLESIKGELASDPDEWNELREMTITHNSTMKQYVHIVCEMRHTHFVMHQMAILELVKWSNRFQ